MPQNKTEEKTKFALIKAAFELVDPDEGLQNYASPVLWRHITLEDIAQKAGLPLADSVAEFSGKADLLCAYFRDVDRQMMLAMPAQTPDPTNPDSANLPVKDILFDLMMERFEIMNQDRGALVPIITSFTPDPLDILIYALRLRQSLGLMLKAANLPDTGLRGMIRRKGLMVIYLLALRVWLKDDSPDLSSTMVRVDQLLGQADRWATTLSL